MNIKEKVVFMCKTANLNIVKKKGATIVTAVPGGTKSEVTPSSWIKFREHQYLATDPEEIEIIREHIREYPNDGIMELIRKTPQDILREKEIEMDRLKEEMEEARKAAGVEEKPEEELPDYKCPYCGLIRHEVKKMKRHCQNSHNKNVSLERIEKEFLVKK